MNKAMFVQAGDKVAFKGMGRWTVDAVSDGYLYLSRKVRGSVEKWKVLATRTFA